MRNSLGEPSHSWWLETKQASNFPAPDWKHGGYVCMVKKLPRYEGCQMVITSAESSVSKYT